MIITEKDIFCYVKHRNVLSTEKIKFIEKHIENFRVEIDFLKKISSQNESPDNSIRLFKKENQSRLNQTQLRLAAAKDVNNLETSADTFFDDEQRFIAKVISLKSEKRIYVFDKEGNALKNISVIIVPGNKTYLSDINIYYIKIPATTPIESIKINLL